MLSPAASTAFLPISKILHSQEGTGAPKVTACYARDPSSPMMYQTITSGASRTE